MPDHEYDPAAGGLISEAESRCLWPDPWDAPEVPPPSLLLAWRDGILHDEHLAEQIIHSPNCRRALALLDLMPGIEPAAGGLPMPNMRGAETTPELGELWTTCNVVETFNQECPGWRWTFDPVPVLLVAGPFERPGGTVWRALATSPESLWPEDWRTEEDLLVDGGEAGPRIVHLLLEYPVAQAQLYRRFGRVSEETLGQLCALGLSLPEGLAPEIVDSDSEDGEAEAERDRLLARCAFLPATADARRLQAEWWEGQWDALRDGLAPSGEKSGSDRNLVPSLEGDGEETHRWLVPGEVRKAIAGIGRLALAAKTAGEPASLALAVGGLPAGLAAKRLLSRLKQSGSVVSCPVAGAVPETPDFEFPLQWEIDALELAPGESVPFVVLSPDHARVLARGWARDGIASAWEGDRQAIVSERAHINQWLLVVFRSPD